MRFHSGVTVRLIAAQDHVTRSWKVRLPHGVTVDPKIWRTLARRAVWCLVTYCHPEAKIKPEPLQAPAQHPEIFRAEQEEVKRLLKRSGASSVAKGRKIKEDKRR